MTVDERVPGALGRWARHKRSKVLIDSMLLVGFLAEFFTREGPDYALHSWIGIVLVPTVAVHLLSSLGWIQRVWARKREDKDFGLGVLNATLGLLTGVCVATGFPIWLEWSSAGAWSATHTATGFASIIAIFIHPWWNRSRIARLLRQ